MGLFKVRPGNGSKSPIVQFDTTTTQSQGKTLGPAVLVKTRVWVKGCSVSRVHKSGLGRSYLRIFSLKRLLKMAFSSSVSLS